MTEFTVDQLNEILSQTQELSEVGNSTEAKESVVASAKQTILVKDEEELTATPITSEKEVSPITVASTDDVLAEEFIALAK